MPSQNVVEMPNQVSSLRLPLLRWTLRLTLSPK